MIPFLLIFFYGYGLSGYWSLGKLAITAACGAWLALGPIYRRPADILLLAYLAVLAVTSSVSADPWLSIFGLHGTYSSGLLPALCLIPFWAGIAGGDRLGLELDLRRGGLFFALSVLAHYGFFYDSLPTGHRAYGTMGSPVYAGTLLCLCLPFCLDWAPGGLLISALALTGSRGAWLGAAAGVTYLAWPALSHRGRFYAATLPIIGILAAFAIRPVSDLGRVIVYRAALDAFRHRPWLGWGPGNFLMVAELWRNPLWDEAYGASTQDHAHNLFLEAAATSGILGIVALSALLFCLWRVCGRRTRGALLGVGICGMLNPLPVVVKALCLMLAASGSAGEKTFSRPHAYFVKGFVVINFFIVAWLIHLDRMMTYYGDYPWAFSSVWAAYYAGIIKEVVTRSMFKL